MNVNGLGDLLGNLAADSLGNMEEERQVFQQQMASQNDQVTASANRIMDRMNKRRAPQGPQYSPEVTGIANMLTQFPKMIPVVTAIIYKLTAVMDKAFVATADQYVNDPEVQEVLKQQQAQAAAQQPATAGGG